MESKADTIKAAIKRIRRDEYTLKHGNESYRIVSMDDGSSVPTMLVEVSYARPCCAKADCANCQAW